MPLSVAVNPQTQETVVLVNGQWQPAAQVAQHGQSGEKAYLVGGQWLTDSGPDKSMPAPAAPKGVIQKGVEAVESGLNAYGGAGLNLASGAVAPIAAGLAGIGQGAANTVRRAVGAPIEHTVDDTVRQTEQALTYQPRTPGGQAYVEGVTAPLRVIAEGANKAGEKTAEFTGSPLLGAAVNTGIQGAAMLAGPKALEAARERIAPTAAAPAPTPTTAAAAAAARAKDYATTRLGVDWDALSTQFKDTLTSIASDAKKLDALPVEAVKRQAQLQSLRTPVTTTAGKLSRDPAALRNEANVAATNAGKPIRDIDTETNRQLRSNVEGLRRSVGGQGKTRATAGDEGTAGTAEEVGRNVQTPLRLKEQISRKNYNDLYAQARATEPNARVSPDPMYEFVRGNPEVLNPQIQHLGWLQSWLKKAGIEKLEEGEGGQESVQRRPIRLEELDDLRKKAVSLARGGGPDAHYAGEVIKAIDKSFEEIPDAAKAWKSARNAFKQHKEEFEETNAVERLVADQSKADPKTALEDTWKKSVQTAKLQEIRDLKKSLLSGGSDATRAAGKKALRELKQETVNQYLSYITRKSATNEAGETQITAVQMVEGLKHIGGEARVREILGNRATNELKKIIEAAKITKTEPSIRSAGSSTLQNLLAFAEKWIDKVPAVGKYGAGAIKGVQKIGELGEEGRIARKAAEQPTDKLSKKAQVAVKRKARREALGRAGARVAGPAAQGEGNRMMTLRDDSSLGDPK